MDDQLLEEIKEDINRCEYDAKILTKEQIILRLQLLEENFGKLLTENRGANENLTDYPKRSEVEETIKELTDEFYYSIMLIDKENQISNRRNFLAFVSVIISISLWILTIV